MRKFKFFDVHPDNFLLMKDDDLFFQGVKKYPGYSGKPDIYLFGNSSIINFEVPTDSTLSYVLFRKYGLQVANCGLIGETLINVYNRVLSVRPKVPIFIDSSLDICNSQPKLPDKNLNYRIEKTYHSIESIQNLFGFLIRNLCKTYKVTLFSFSSKIFLKKLMYRTRNFRTFDFILNRNLYIDTLHPNKLGIEKYAKILYELYKRNLFLNADSIQVDELVAKRDFIRVQKIQSLYCNYFWESNLSVLRKKVKYIQYVSSLKSDKKVTGYIGVTCDPLTNGHLEFIKQASSQVDILYIQLMTHSSTHFPYNIRRKMLESCIPDNCIIYKKENDLVNNKIKFNNYFLKAELNCVDNVDEIVDFEEFAKSLYNIYIRPLGITDFFVGNEIEDKITRRLVRDKIKIFCQNGMKCHLIDRVNNISATRCRKLIIERHYNELENLIPLPVLNIIKSET